MLNCESFYFLHAYWRQLYKVMTFDLLCPSSWQRPILNLLVWVYLLWRSVTNVAQFHKKQPFKSPLTCLFFYFQHRQASSIIRSSQSRRSKNFLLTLAAFSLNSSPVLVPDHDCRMSSASLKWTNWGQKKESEAIKQTFTADEQYLISLRDMKYSIKDLKRMLHRKMLRSSDDHLVSGLQLFRNHPAGPEILFSFSQTVIYLFKYLS